MSIAADRFAGIRAGSRPRPVTRPPVAAAAPRLAPGIADAAPSRPVTWSTVDRGFHVASRAGEFVGSIDATDGGHFIAFDGTNSPIGRYGTMVEAKRAVTSWEPERKRERERELARVFQPVATSAGIVAMATAVIAMLSTALSA